MNLAPVIVFCYNRPDHLTKTLAALNKNKLATETELFVYSDGPMRESDCLRVEEVRAIIRHISGFKAVKCVERSKNLGLANSVISGVTEVIRNYGKVIVVEDDLVTSPFFLQFMNDCLNFYESNQSIFSISGYVPKLKHASPINEDVFLFSRISSWGWASWVDRWNSVDWSMTDFNTFIRNKEKRRKFNYGGIDLTNMLLNQKRGKINSWAIRFSYACFIQNKYCLYPRYSLVKNIGADGSGTHLKNTRKYINELHVGEIIPIKNPQEDLMINNEFKSFHKSSKFRQIINLIIQKLYIIKN